MARLRRTREGTYEGREGFFITVENNAKTPTGAEKRAKSSIVMRFPKAVTGIKATNINQISRSRGILGTGVYRTEVFVPTQGFLSAGIRNPVRWLQQQFDESTI